MRLLLVDDDLRFTAMLGRALGRAGYDVDTIWNAAGAKTKLRERRYGAVLLDLGLPDHPGIDVCRDLRARHDTTPVLVVSGLATADERIASLDAGADDYLVKPFHVGELKARLRALDRRNRAVAPDVYRVGNLTVALHPPSASVGTRLVDLTAKELALLGQMAQIEGGVISRAELHHRLWGDLYPESKTLEVHVNSVRRKLLAAGATATIENRRTLGYRLVAPSP